mmetsp:Transcript_6315/g.9573  ORF Transcript_6315/g.9573 Transcript_6315/m.9573 type:complete len:326 (-) Transcript_6315:73-1050(-)
MSKNKNPSEITTPPVVQGVVVAVNGKPLTTTPSSSTTIPSMENAVHPTGATDTNDPKEDDNTHRIRNNPLHKIRLVPGDDWLNRQTADEILSLSWDQEEVPHVVSLLSTRQFLGNIHIAMLLLSSFMFFFLMVDYGSMLWFKVSFSVVCVVQFVSLVKLSNLENLLKQTFLRFKVSQSQRQQPVVDNPPSSATTTHDRRLVQVLPDHNWIPRHTEQEILSLSWDEEDIPQVLDLLEKRRKLAHLHGMVSVFLFVVFFIFLFGYPLLSEAATYGLVGLLVLICGVSLYLSILNGRVIDTFQSVFDQRFCGEKGGEYKGEVMTSDVV